MKESVLVAIPISCEYPTYWMYPLTCEGTIAPRSSSSLSSSGTLLPLSALAATGGSPTRSGNSASIDSIRSVAMPAMTSGSWIDLAMWWMK